ncbi:hypothetical protein PG996_000129 [Apiospora saccharicola]|uniref:Uncharacterized protein n=1 Tax=Apiospora saccharicola TaxID=335842 RepID=A0ABR1WGY8_9PEZI
MDGTVITQTPIGGSEATNTVWLPAQTTPFTPLKFGTELSCEPSISCEESSDCWPMWLTTWGTSSATMAFERPSCFPSGYYNIGSHLSVAFPGTACISGWHAACDTTFGYLGQTYSQIWCCPSGGYECMATETYFSTTMRACASWVTDPTGYVLMGRDDGGDGATAIDTVVYPVLPSGKGLLYRVEAMPLQIPPKTTSTSSSGLLAFTTVPGSASIDYGPGETAASDSADAPRQLSKGSIAGAISASIVGVLIIAAMVFVCIRCRRRTRRLQASGTAAVVNQGGVDLYYGKPELPTNDVARAELDGYGMYHEMDGGSRPVEALSPHTIADKQAEKGVEAEAKRPDGGVTMGR